MKLKRTLAMLVLACAAGTGVATAAGAATLGAGNMLSVRQTATAEATADRSRLWQARDRRHDHHWRRHDRRYRHGPNFGITFGFPFWALAPPHYYDPPPVYYPPPAYYAPPPARWRFDGVGWVCDYIDYYGRPLCR